MDVSAQGEVIVEQQVMYATSEDAEEKRSIGAIWESRNAGRCLFVMPAASDFAAIDRKITGR